MNYKFLLSSLLFLVLTIMSYKHYISRKKKRSEIKDESEKMFMRSDEITIYWPLIIFSACTSFGFLLMAFE